MQIKYMNNNDNNNNVLLNVINNKRYLISSDLQQQLESPASVGNQDYFNRTGNKHPDGIYLVMFRLLNKKSDVLVYNYMNYSPLFLSPLLTYLSLRDDIIPNAVFREWGDYISIVDTSLMGDSIINSKLDLSLCHENLRVLLASVGKSEYLATDLKSTLNLINKLTYLADYDLMSKLIDLANKKNYLEFIKEILNSVDNAEMLIGKLSSIENVRSINIINSCLFVVKDIDKFINNLRDKGLSANCGPQPLRGQVNSISNFLSCLDMDFRKGLYNHNRFHVMNGNIDRKFLLTRNKFSFVNIHMNTGNVHYYSTTARSVIKTSPQSSLVKQDKQFLARSIFKDLKRFIENNPINSDTQRKIESFILSQYNWWESVKPSHSVLSIDMDIFTPKFNKFLLEKRELIYSYVAKVKMSKSIPKLKSSDPLSSKNNVYYLNKIINTLDNNKIMDLILYNFFKLVTYNEGDYENISELKLAIAFGKNISREYLVALYKEYIKSKGNILFSEWKAQHVDIVLPYEDNSRLFDFIGTRLFVELLIQTDLIHEKIIISTDEKNKQFKILSLNTEVLHLVEGNKIYVAPLKLPMIVEPKPYTSKQLGGYLLNDVEVTENLLINKANYREPSEIEKDSNIIYDMVNNMNKTSYKVNKEVLDFVLEYGVEYGMIEDINIKHPYEDIKRNKRQDKIIRAHKSKIILEQNILGITSVYSGVSMYFPVRLDQRGRIYCEPIYFNYQSSELAKSLISFTFPGIIKRKDIVAVGYFKAYGANCYGHGLDKKSFYKRVQWLDKNVGDILDYKNGKLLIKAKNKCLFLAFCMEYSRYAVFQQGDSSEFLTYLPIQLDATCNGFQHLALLSNETKVFKELNISKTSKGDDPKDFYTFMKNSLTLIFKGNSGSENISESDRESYKRLNSVLWDRKNIKQAIMTIPYNASLFSIIQYIKDTLKKCELSEEEFEISKQNETLRKQKLVQGIKPITRWYGMADQVIPKRMITDRDIFLLANTINDVINRDFPKITKLSDYLLNVASICNSLGIPISWSLPHGLHIYQSYLLTKTAAIKPFTFVKSSFKLRVSDKTQFDKSKQKIALMPNLIHSLDAASLSLLYDRFYAAHKPIVNFYAIHDCFTTTCDKVDSLINLLKVVYLSLYTEDNYLRKFDKGIIDSIKYHYSNDCVYDSDNRIFYLENVKYKLYDIEEVLGKNLPTNLTSDLINESQYLII